MQTMVEREVEQRLAWLESIRYDIDPDSYIAKRNEILSGSAGIPMPMSGMEGRVMPTGMGGYAVEDESESLDEGNKLLQKIKEAGVAGIISYGVVQIAFWGASIPFCIFAYYQVTGHWPDLSNAEDQAKLSAEAFAFLNLARLAIPLRIALALSMTQKVQTDIVDRFQRNKQ